MDASNGAVITAVTSFAVAVVAASLAAVNGQQLSRLNATLKEQELRLTDELERRRSAGNAKQEYEYEAPAS
jgi:hypothetical protein